MTGTTATSRCATGVETEDWSMIWQKGLAFLEWQPLFFEFTQQEWDALEVTWGECFWQMPQGVRAIRTPIANNVRWMMESVFRMT